MLVFNLVVLNKYLSTHYTLEKCTTQHIPTHTRHKLKITNNKKKKQVCREFVNNCSSWTIFIKTFISYRNSNNNMISVRHNSRVVNVWKTNIVKLLTQKSGFFTHFFYLYKIKKILSTNSVYIMYYLVSAVF